MSYLPDILLTKKEKTRRILIIFHNLFWQVGMLVCWYVGSSEVISHDWTVRCWHDEGRCATVGLLMVTRVSGERNSNTPPRRQHSRLNLLPPSYSLLSEAIFPDPYLYLSLYISLSRCLYSSRSFVWYFCCW